MIKSENQIDFNEIVSALRHIAFGSNADAIKLLLHSDSLTGRQIKRLDTFNIASIKQTGSSQAYSAFSAGESGSLGLEITGGGFRVKNGSTYAVSGITPLLNEAGTGYVYLAFRGVNP
ncbi:MAG: hypothetical protein IK097_09440 [Clostridia bacterium]|nr:hypothetical protein [Clostridia bacterium]